MRKQKAKNLKALAEEGLDTDAPACIPSPTLVHFVTPEMKSQGRRALIEDPLLLDRLWNVEKIVNKGVDQESWNLMYLVKWEDERQKTWEFYKDLIQDGATQAIEEYEVRHFTNEVAMQSHDKDLIRSKENGEKEKEKETDD